MHFVQERIHGRKAVAREEAKEQRKVAKETAEHVGNVAPQDTLQLFAQMDVTRTCMPLMETRLKPLKTNLTLTKSPKRGVC